MKKEIKHTIKYAKVESKRDIGKILKLINLIKKALTATKQK
jgi:hypothetical protein